MPHEPAPILLVDDGDLDDVRALLAELGAPFRHLRGGAVPPSLDPPALLYVCNPRRARLAEPWPGPGAGPTRICIVTEDSHTARAMMRRMGFDYLVRRPFHPFALRLLLLRALYGGDERRGGRRVAIGAPTSYRAGLRRHACTLADLSLAGCRLLTRLPLPLGNRVSVRLPGGGGPGRGTWLRARVTRVDAPTPSGEHVSALQFEGMTETRQRKVREVLRRLSDGPAVLTEGVALPAPDVGTADHTAAAAPRHPAATMERRKAPRSAYGGEVVHLDGEAGRVLVGRDISSGGMRVEPRPDLEPGDSLRLAIYGSGRESPFIVRARVVSNDGPAGVGLRFDELQPAVAARIESLVAQLPTVEPLQDGESDALGSVVSRVLRDEDPGG